MKLEEISTALGNHEEEQRRQAVIALGAHAVPATTPVLMQALGDESWRVREEAVRVGLDLSPAVDVIPTLVQAICQGDNVGLRNSALALLGAIGPAAHEALKRALGEVEHDARKFVLEALAAAGGPGVVRILVEHLHSGDANMVAAALDALAVVGGDEGEKALRDVLSWSDAFQRMAAMDALNRIDAVVPWDELSPLLADRLVFRVALPALGRSGDVRAVPPLVSALAERSMRVLSDAVAALCNLLEQVPDALPVLAKELGSIGTDVRSRLAGLDADNRLQTRRGAAIVLCLTRDVRGLDATLQLLAGDVLFHTLRQSLLLWGGEAIERLLEDFAKAGEVRALAALELAATLAEELRESLGAPLVSRLRSELRKALYGADLEMRLVSARNIGPWAEGADAVPLVEAASSDESDLAQACGRALVALADREPDAVREALAQEELSGAALTAVAGLLVSLEGDKALRRFQAALLLDDPLSRCAALAGLSTLGGERAAELISLALTDPALEVQLAAADALGDLPDELGVTPLLLCLDGSPPELQAAVAGALGRTGSARAHQALTQLLETSVGESAVQVAALTSMHQLSVPGLRELLVKALAARDAEVVKQALCVLSESDEGGFEHLRAALSDRRWDVRQLAVGLVGATGHGDAIPALEARAEEEQDEMVKSELVAVLARLRGAR